MKRNFLREFFLLYIIIVTEIFIGLWSPKDQYYFFFTIQSKKKCEEFVILWCQVLAVALALCGSSVAVIADCYIENFWKVTRDYSCRMEFQYVYYIYEHSVTDSHY